MRLNKEIYGIKMVDLPKMIIIIFGISIICFLFPINNNQFSYRVGTQWHHDDLYADNDFTATIDILQGKNKDSLVQSTVFYKKGSLIISKNQFVTQAVGQALDQYLEFGASKTSWLSWEGLIYFLGYFILTTLIIGALVMYAYKYFPETSQSIPGIVFLILWPVMFSVIVYLVSHQDGLSPYMIPFCITPIVVLNFYNGRLGLVIHIVVVLIASFLSNLGYEFIFLQVVAGIVTVLVMTETRFWNKFFRAILIIWLTYLLAYLGLAIINSGTIVPAEGSIFGWLTLNAVLLLLAYPFIPMLEKLFGFTSNISLAELSDLNKPLLRDLSLKAPGTLQHSLQVANLAEAAAKEIGANSLLVKTAALYHDIGKSLNPLYFIENSMGSNPHENINNFESAKIIIDHVVEGEAMAKKAKLPKLLVDFITTHHGTTRVEYFYRQQINQEPDREFDESLFHYPGPKPTTKEQSILMLADTIEAACKSLKNPTGQDIDTLIDNLVNFKIDQKQLEDSQLSFAELQKCIQVFKSLLRSIYHVRIEYPA